MSEAGHLAEWHEEREALSKFGTDLRQSFKTISVESGVGKPEAKILMNHKVYRDVPRRLCHDAGTARAPPQLSGEDQRGRS